MRERKIYTSFYEIPGVESREVYFYPKPKKSITSKTEIIHLIIAIAILSIAFSFPLGGGGLLLNGFESIKSAIKSYPLALFSILTGFFFHELSHKFVALRYGLWAEFRMYPEGLVFALLIGALIGFVFAAPGAVTIQGGARRFEIGRIAAAGPIANIVVAFISLVGYLSLGLDSNLGKILGFLCFINIFLAIFNLLPFDPLDGKKVIAWNAFAWGILMAIAIVIFFFYWNRMFILGIS